MSSTSLQNDLQKQINEQLQAISLPEFPRSLYDPVRYSLTNGGKRIRPYLTLLAAGMCDGAIEHALPASLSVEILHNFTLVHDDIMDQADVRRGEPCVHKKWNESTAILSGDVMFGKSFELLNYYGKSDLYTKREYVAMLQAFQKAVITVCEGQALDMELTAQTNASLQEYMSMIKGKTAALLSASLAMGGISAHASEDHIQKLFALGEEMGVAFQIQDDLLDAIADPEKFGKKPGGDIYEGKKTYLSLLTLERADELQKKIFEHIFNEQKVTETEVQTVLELYESTNVISDTKQAVEEHYNRAFELLNNFEETPYKQELNKLLSFLKERDH